MLIDIRHKPGANDVQMYEWIKSSGFEPVIIATKADKLKRSQLQGQIKVIKETFALTADARLFTYSAQTKQGREEIYGYLDDLLA